MNSLIYLFRFIYRIRWWLLIGPALAALFVIYKTQKMSHTYQTRTTIYTGAVSGYSIDPDDSGKQDWASTNNTMDNLVNIIVSQSTLRNVSLRLFAQAMMYGSPDKNTNHISAANYRTLMRHVPKEVVALIDKNSEENTLANLEDYEKASPDNYVYGLFHYTHRHYSYQALSKIVVKRLGNSDMIQVSYESDDPGIAYNTLGPAQRRVRQTIQGPAFRRDEQRHQIFRAGAGTHAQSADRSRRLAARLQRREACHQLRRTDQARRRTEPRLRTALRRHPHRTGQHAAADWK